MSRIIFEQYLDQDSSTYTFLIADSESREAALVDSVRENVAFYKKRINELGLNLVYLFETHVHADHVTGNGQLQDYFPKAQVALSANANVKFPHLPLRDGHILKVGKIEIKTMYTLGHTNDSVSFLVDGNRILTGDSLFIGSCGRTDFQAGDSRIMFQTLKKIAALPPDTLVYPGHDYNNRWVSSVSEQLCTNKLLSMTEDEFVAELAAWNLPPPRKIKESVPANLLNGRSPAEGRRAEAQA
jgi:glyoxylase-like metal-dependent hydrolase (beta-lactamase superfamily II)